jgi:hypothetical protein
VLVDPVGKLSNLDMWPTYDGASVKRLQLPFSSPCNFIFLNPSFAPRVAESPWLTLHSMSKYMRSKCRLAAAVADDHWRLLLFPSTHVTELVLQSGLVIGHLASRKVSETVVLGVAAFDVNYGAQGV